MPKFPLTRKSAQRRLADVRSGGKGGRTRNPAIDRGKRAKTVAPLGRSQRSISLQRRWYASPGTMDLQGIDTPTQKTKKRRGASTLHRARSQRKRTTRRARARSSRRRRKRPQIYKAQKRPLEPRKTMG